MAVCPTELGEFRSVEQLEYKEGRLWELIYQLQHSITEDTMQKQLSQVEVLKHSPFAKLPVILPNVLDRGSGKRVTFPASSDLTIVARGKVSFEDEFGLVRGNNVIPNSLPTYYFEYAHKHSEVLIACTGSHYSNHRLCLLVVCVWHLVSIVKELNWKDYQEIVTVMPIKEIVVNYGIPSVHRCRLIFPLVTMWVH